MSTPNPLAAIGNAISEAVKSANRKRLDEIFVFVDPDESPLTHSIRAQGDDGNEILRGIILTLAELEKRLPGKEGKAA
jgi:hypothetical protein